MATTQALTLTQVSQSVANNTSKVRILWTTTQTGSSYNNYEKVGYYWVSINGGAETKHTVYSTLPLQSTKTLVDTIIEVPHNTSGDCTVSVRTSFATGITAGTIELEKSLTLDNIPRASTITSVNDVTLGDKCSVKWTPNSASFRFKLEFSIGEWSDTTDVIHPNTTSPYTYTGYTIPLDAAWQIPNVTTGTMTVTLYTYFNSDSTTHEGSVSTKTFTVTVPPSALPKVSSIVLTPVHSLDEAFDGIYIQGCSKVKAEITAETQYGSAIDYCDFTMEGKTYGKYESYTSAYIANSGSVSVVCHAVDSRGYGGYENQPINVIPYTKPKVQNVTAERCDSEGNPDDSGTYLKISAKRVYSKVESDGVQKNFCSIRYRYKTENGEYGPWVTILSNDNTATDEIITSALLEGTLAIDRTYYVQVGVVDDIGNDTHTTVTIPTDKVYWHRDGAQNALGLGKYNEKTNAVDSAWDFYMNGHKITGLPTPTKDSDAVPKSYVDKADVKLTKTLDTMGWYKLGTVSGEMCAVVTVTIGGEYGNDDPSPSMVDIATQYNHSRAFLRLPAVADNQVSKFGLIQESASGCGVYLYYNSMMANTVKVNIHTHMGNFTSGGLAASNASESTMIAVITLIE